jgi:hypothetical protein
MKNRLQLLAAVGMVSLFMVSTAFADVIQDHYGKWLGKISIPNGPTLSVGIELFARADGSPGASMAFDRRTVVQGVLGGPISSCPAP